MRKSDHQAFIVSPKATISYNKGQVNLKTTRIQGPNEKAMFVHAIKQVDWTPMYFLDKCEAQCAFFDTIVRTMIETYFPLKTTKVHTKDKPWITQSFKDLIINSKPYSTKTALSIEPYETGLIAKK